MLRWKNWLIEMQKKHEEEHQNLVSNMIESADGGTDLLHKNHQANGVECRV